MTYVRHFTIADCGIVGSVSLVLSSITVLSGDAIFQLQIITQPYRPRPISIHRLERAGQPRKGFSYADQSMTKKFALPPRVAGRPLVDRSTANKNPSRIASIADRDRRWNGRRKSRQAAEMRVASTTSCVATGAQ
jgi:hypothetical protein